MNTTALLLSHAALATSALAAPLAAWQVPPTDVTNTRLFDSRGVQPAALEFGRSIAANGEELAISARLGMNALVDIRKLGPTGWATNDLVNIDGLMIPFGNASAPLRFLESAGALPQSLDFEGNVLAVGAHQVNSTPAFDGNGHGVVLVYERPNANSPFPTIPFFILPPLAVGSTTDRLQDFGYSVDVQGDRIAVGSLGSGSRPGGVVVYERSNGGWDILAELAPLQSSSDSGFGFDVALHGDVLLVGAPTDRDPVSGARVGAVTTFDLGAPNPQATEQRNFSPTREAGGGFGASLASDGTTLLVGEPHGRTGSVRTGRAYEFSVSGSGIAFSLELDPSGGTNVTPVALAEFGTAVAVDGPVRLVGASGPALQAQFGYEFHVTPTGTLPIRLTRAPLVAGNSDKLGEAVAIANGAIFLGAQGSSVNPNGVGGQGVVFQYNRQCSVEQVACVQPLNSTGRQTRLEWTGIPSQRTDGLRLSIRDASPGSYSGLMSSSSTQTPIPSMFGNGFECLNVSSRSFVGRLSETDAAGNAEFDFRASTSGAMSGMTMYYQALHRDRTASGGASVNYSGVLSVQFCF